MSSLLRMSPPHAVRAFDAALYKTDKGDLIWDKYVALSKPLHERFCRVLVLSLAFPDELLAWADMLPRGRIYGLGCPAPTDDREGRVRVFEGKPWMFEAVNGLLDDLGPVKFDMIIDNASHVAGDSWVAFSHLFGDHLVDGGLYVLESWAAAYHPNFVDGGKVELIFAPGAAGPGAQIPSHSNGLAGFTKALMDHVAQADIRAANPELSKAPFFPVGHIQVDPNFVVCERRADSTQI